jgi:glutaredoxin
MYDMTKPARHPSASLSALLASLCVLGSGAALAQYKVVAPDGSVTYTDRPPISTANKVTELRRSATLTIDNSNAVLPLGLRQIAARFPVVLYVATACPSCDQGKAFLTQRGVPFAEQVIKTEDEALDVERKLGWRTVPSLTIGAQGLRGWSATEWTAYLDLAGYPRESRLPKPAVAAPQTAAKPASAEAAPAPPVSLPPTPTAASTARANREPAPAAAEQTAPSKIRF